MLSAKEVREFDIEKDFYNRCTNVIDKEIYKIQADILFQRKQGKSKLELPLYNYGEYDSNYSYPLTSIQTYILAWKYAKPLYEERGYTVEINKKVIISWGDNTIQTYTLKPRKKLSFDRLIVLIAPHLILLGIFGFIFSILKACNLI